MNKIKFHTLTDLHHFLVEMDKIDLISEAKDLSYPISEDLVELYVQRRKGVISKLKNFRKSQSSKEAWRGNRRKYMSGIKSYHRSTQGKRHHRAMGRFLATRNTRDNNYKRESLDSVDMISEISEVLKALSSLRTHLYIEHEYYHPVDEQVEFELLIEDLVDQTVTIERKIVMSEVLSEIDLNLLLDLTDLSVLAEELKVPALHEDIDIKGLNVLKY
jgi:hypothetical protein